MIWIWALFCVIVSVIVAGKEHFRLNHLIWVLLPIDMYGVKVAGITLKPYMIFAFVMLLYDFLRKKGRIRLRFNQWSVAVLVLFCLMLLVDLINGSGLASIRQHIMFILVFICSWIYFRGIRSYDEIEHIERIIVATAIGYGSMYLLAVLMTAFHLDVPGVSTWIRLQPGLVLKFYDIPDGRLRGFMIDPNVLATSFLTATAISINGVVRSTKKLNVVFISQFLVAALCMFFTKSRMAMISLLITSTLSMYSGIHQSRSFYRKVSALAFISFICVFVVFSIQSDGILSNLYKQYEGRSSFSDPYGRGTLWRSAWNILLDEDSLLWGVGQGQIRNYGERDSHNTWLEWIVGSGFVVGSLVNLYFLSVFLAYSLGRVKGRRCSATLLESGVNWGYLGILLSLVSVDNITNSHLIFTANLIIWVLSARERRPYNMRVKGIHLH